jgi:hypothetical protein
MANPAIFATAASSRRCGAATACDRCVERLRRDEFFDAHGLKERTPRRVGVDRHDLMSGRAMLRARRPSPQAHLQDLYYSRVARYGPSTKRLGPNPRV